jgi:uncharacterized protein (TIGR02996 family)
MTLPTELPMPTYLPFAELRSLLAGIADAPDDPDRRLVLADWLDDHDDPRAELIRWQVRRCLEKGEHRSNPLGVGADSQAHRFREAHEEALGLAGTGVLDYYWGRPWVWLSRPGHCNPAQKLERSEGVPAGLTPLMEAGWVERLNGPAQLVADLGHLLWAVNDLCVEDGDEADPEAVLAAVGNGTALRRLSLAGVGAPDDALRHLAPLTCLQYLDLDCNRLTDAGLKHLETLTRLETLSVADAGGVTDAGLRHLAPLAGLRLLSLSRTGVTDAGLKELAVLTRLRALFLDSTRVTDEGVKQLAALPQLERLRLDWRPASRVEELRRALPGCGINTDDLFPPD